jgi:hypothetical protein
MVHQKNWDLRMRALGMLKILVTLALIYVILAKVGFESIVRGIN